MPTRALFKTLKCFSQTSNLSVPTLILTKLVTSPFSAFFPIFVLLVTSLCFLCLWVSFVDVAVPFGVLKVLAFWAPLVSVVLVAKFLFLDSLS
ncbi:hypothetical protein P8452_13585 [Trifolium repens]|nr:hypothetical protein P8452_13585 [Trifolium repens]